MRIRRRKGWEIPEREATPEAEYLAAPRVGSAVLTRRRFLSGGAAGLGAVGAAGIGSLLASACPGSSRADGESYVPPPIRPAVKGLYPAKRNPKFALDRPLTDETVAATHNNFYEFTEDKRGVWKAAKGFTTHPWAIEVSGRVEKPFTIDVDDLARKLGVEERLYRLRCVEAWAMAVPWTGVSLRAVVDFCKPTADATHLRMVSFKRPSEASGQLKPWYPWPYFEALSLAEARNELAFLATGIYGHELPAQHGAPIRLVAPWKYGLKSIKSIVRLEFTAAQPGTFWNALQPTEYGWYSNVNPDVPHPRWSQASETMIGTGERRVTLPYNGYAEWVAALYPPESRTRIT